MSLLFHLLLYAEFAAGDGDEGVGGLINIVR